MEKFLVFAQNSAEHVEQKFYLGNQVRQAKLAPKTLHPEHTRIPKQPLVTYN